jgi:hypothetical protein
VSNALAVWAIAYCQIKGQFGLGKGDQVDQAAADALTKCIIGGGIPGYCRVMGTTMLEYGKGRLAPQCIAQNRQRYPWLSDNGPAGFEGGRYPFATCASPEACAVPLGPAILNPPTVVYRGPLGPFCGQGRSGRLGIVETSKADLHMACRW